jgi:X-Pro dipeptidyl-peptidase
MNGLWGFLTAVLLSTVVLAGCLGGADKESEAASAKGAAAWAEDDPRLSQPIYDEIVKERVLVASFDGKNMDNWVFRPKTPDNVTVPVFINFSPYWSNLAPTTESGGDAFSLYMIDYFIPRGYAVVLSSARGTGYSEGCFNLGGIVEQRDSYEVIEHFGAAPWSNGNVGTGGKSYDGTMPNGAAVLNPPSLKTIIPVSPISELYKYNYKDGISYSHGYRFNQYYFMGVGMDVQYGQPKTDQPALLIDDAACPYLPEMQAWGLGSGLIGDSSDYWEERNYTRDASKATASMWLIHGLQDWNVKPDNILPWMSEYGGPVKAWLHQWTDGGTGGHVYPMRDDWNITMLRWLDHWLKDIDTGIMDEPAIQVQDTQMRWRNEESWPPTDVRALTVPLAGGTISDQVAYAVPLEIPNGTHIAGEIVVRLSVTSDIPQGRIVAVLNDGEERVTYGGLNLRHRDGIQDPQPVIPGEAYDIVFRLHPADAVLSDKATLRLATAGADYFAPPMGATLTISQVSLSLPTKSSALMFEDPAPVELDACWAC